MMEGTEPNRTGRCVVLCCCTFLYFGFQEMCDVMSIAVCLVFVELGRRP